MSSLSELARQLQVARKELKNIRYRSFYSSDHSSSASWNQKSGNSFCETSDDDSSSELDFEAKNGQDLQKVKACYNKDVVFINSQLSSNSPASSAVPQRCKRKSGISDTLQISDEASFHMKPIGYVESCFKTKNGTPRQASLCPKTKACLKIDRSMFSNPEHSLEGLEDFSHIWVLFVFHQNDGVKNFKAKVHPPRLNGSSLGVYASRSPHRPNPIGLSLTKLEKVDGNTVYMSGVDFIDGTPVLDIKPYVPSYDFPLSRDFCTHEGLTQEGSVQKATPTCTGYIPPGEDELHDYKLLENHNFNHSVCSLNSSTSENVLNHPADFMKLKTLQNPDECCESITDDAVTVKTAPWLLSKSSVSLKVIFTERAEKDLVNFHCKSEEHQDACNFCLDFISGASEAKSSIINILQNDPRSVYRRKKCSDRLYYCTVDAMHVTCWFDDSVPVAEVLRIQCAKKV